MSDRYVFYGCCHSYFLFLLQRVKWGYQLQINKRGKEGGQALGFSFINLFEQQYILTCLSSDCNVIMLLYTDQGNRV